MAIVDLVFLPEDFALGITAEPIEGLNMEDYSFEVEVFSSSSKRLRLKKEELIRDSENTYIAAIHSPDLGVGPVRCRVIARIPDNKFEGGERVDIDEFKTNIQIVKQL